MPLDLAEFNTAFSRARDKVRNQEGTDVAAEQEKLRALVPDDASEHDRTWTKTLIDGLADPPPPPRQWSALYHEAGKLHANAYPDGGTVEEQIAALEEARRKIWEIADRAAEDEAPHIRAMSRVLEHLENELRDPTWPLEDPPGQAH
jgi:nitroimidazol reductase NimA-like FMN-containing flavoprotein (pyridoxamine 5'-phosphate oxidase superfamily)